MELGGIYLTYPRLIINREIIEENTRIIVDLCRKRGIEVAAVTKGICAYEPIVESFLKSGVRYLADSRIENLKRLEKYKMEKIMLRLPMLSEVEDLVDYADISLNSEYTIIKAISQVALRNKKVHKIILMLDLGDLREGYFYEKDLYRDMDKIVKLEGIKIIGIGTNLTCYGGLIPERPLLERLLKYKNKLEKDYNLDLPIISGGNSSTLDLVEKGQATDINHLRLGEALLLGRETAYGRQIEGTNPNGFILEIEIIEVKSKPSLPSGKIGMNAFGEKPKLKDKGVGKRILCALGRQDVKIESLKPKDKDLLILGASSDHLIIDGGNSSQGYQVGDILKFNLGYGGILSAMTSEYVNKIYI